jgi:protoporphyrinogen/coproporphyrinogen III oxidase
MKTAVIGGGISGLVAAHELVKAGNRPILVEPAQPGGMIQTQSVNGFTLEQGPNVLVERPDMKSLLLELGLADRVRYPAVQPYGQYVWFRDKPEKVPQGLADLVKSPLFSAATKMLLPYRLAKPGLLRPQSDDLSVLDFFAPLLGEQAARDLLDPVLKGIYGGDITQLSARTLFPGLWKAAEQGLSLIGYMRQRPQGGKPSIMVLEGGIQMIARALVERMRGRIEWLQARVEGIERISAQAYRLRCSDGAAVDVDACVVTPAGAPLARMIRGLAGDLAAVVEQQEYASLGVVHLSVPRAEPLVKDAFGVLFQAGMPNDLLGVMFNSQIFPHVAPPDRHVLTAMVGGAQAQSQEFDEAVLKAELPKQLSSLLGVSSITWLGLTAWRKAIPQLKVGHYKVVAKFDEVEAANPGIVFAGVDRGGIGVTDRVRIAREAVARMHKGAVRYESVA